MNKYQIVDNLLIMWKNLGNYFIS